MLNISPLSDLDWSLRFQLPPRLSPHSPELEESSHSQPPFNNGREYCRTETSDASLSCAASTLCSFLKPVESSSIPKNVRFSSLSSYVVYSLFYCFCFLYYLCFSALELLQ